MQAGVDANKVRAVPLGAAPPHGMREVTNRRQHGGKCLFIFAGGIRELKGIDVMLAAFRRLHAEGLSCRLSLVGGLAEPGWLDEIRATPNAQYHAGVAQPALYRMLGQADCLVLPSRFDSFGMVVAEAMACGTPAIVSTQTGAKTIIEQHPRAGWIVEPDEESLYKCLKERISNPDSLFAARVHALEASTHYTWSAYRERVGDLIQGFLA